MQRSMVYTEISSPIGELCVVGDGEHLMGLYMPNHRHWKGLDPTWKKSGEAFVEVREQLEEYFAGTRQVFDVPRKMVGTPFQQQVWEELVKIPLGETISYGTLAARVGNAAASRAVGMANGRNPISIIVPCHRVIGSTGKLTGYGGGMANKEWLLNWESEQANREGNLSQKENEAKRLFV